jgi:hypothetical protein
MRVTAWIALVIGVGGCGTGEGAAYILLDEPARAGRVEVAVDGRPHGGALPIEVDPVATVELLTPSGRRGLLVRSGRLFEVRGPGAALQEWVLGTELHTDRVGVEGPEEMVRTLASGLGAGAPQPWNGRWRLEGPDALVRLAWMGDVAAITEVSLVPSEEGRVRARQNTASLLAAVPIGAPVPDRHPRAPDGLLAPMVGYYTSEPDRGGEAESLLLDAEGDFTWTRACDRPPIVGQYRVRHGQLELDGTNLAFRIGDAGRLEAPGLSFSTGGDR